MGNLLKQNVDDIARIIKYSMLRCYYIFFDNILNLISLSCIVIISTIALNTSSEKLSSQSEGYIVYINSKKDLNNINNLLTNFPSIKAEKISKEVIFERKPELREISELLPDAILLKGELLQRSDIKLALRGFETEVLTNSKINDNTMLAKISIPLFHMAFIILLAYILVFRNIFLVEETQALIDIGASTVFIYVPYFILTILFLMLGFLLSKI